MWPKYFYPRPPRGGRPTQSAASVPEKAISIHALREEGDLFSSTSTQMGRISIHALREEGDRAVSRMPSPYSRFLSTPSARRATRLDRSEYIGGYNFYPRPPRGGRRDVLLRAAAHSSISIHALREEGDAGSSCGASCRSRFLSTPSARRATGLPGRSAGRPDNFYPRPPRGGRHQRSGEPGCGGRISIHALREEGDASSESAASTKRQFLSTPSARRATLPRLPEKPYMEISIHALREEGDGCSTTTTPSQTYFYPRPPRGGRLPARPAESHDQRISIHALREEGDADGGIWKLEAKKFLSTPSARRATRPCTRISTTPSDFYPRPPRGGRLSRSGNELHPTQFLSTPSARRATGSPVILFLESEFLSTPSARRATTSCRRHSPRQRGFLSTPSARRATRAIHGGETFQWNFYPRPPRGGRPGMPRPLRTVCGISIHALREEGDSRHAVPSLALGISIHALREEGDDCNAWSHGVAIGISIHALREEGDHVLAPAHSK